MKTLVQGKRVTIEEDENRWVIFKYKRIPNFYYNCRLLSHDWKDCLVSIGPDKILELTSLQYGLWLRGEIMNRSTREAPKVGNKAATESTRSLKKGDWGTTTEEVCLLMAITEVGQESKSNFHTLGNSTTRKETNKTEELEECTEVVHEIRGGGVNNKGSSLGNILTTLGKKVLEKAVL